MTCRQTDTSAMLCRKTNERTYNVIRAGKFTYPDMQANILNSRTIYAGIIASDMKVENSRTMVCMQTNSHTMTHWRLFHVQ